MTVVLALTSLILILWAGAAAWQRPCRGVGVMPGGPPECPSRLEDLIPLIIALGFWAIGLVVWCAGRPGLTAAFFLMVAGVLATGKLSTVGNDWGWRLFYVLLAWLAPLALHFHLALLERPPERVGRAALGTLSGLAAAWSLPFLFSTIATLQQRGWFAILRPGVRLTLALAVVLAMLLLFWDYRHRASPAARHRIRLVVFGTVFAFTPLLLLSLLPDTLGAPAYVPYEWTFPWLLLSPLAYAYSLFRHRLVKTEVALNRAAVYYLLITLLLSAYLVAAAALSRLTSDPTGRWPLASALLSVGLLLLFVPLYQTLQRLVRWVLYGGEVSYGGVVGPLADSLALTLDRATLQRLLTDELASLLHLSKCALWLREPPDTLTLVHALGFESDDPNPSGLPAEGRLATYLEAVAGPAAGSQIRRALARAALQAGEQAWLSRTDVVYWLPLVSSSTLQGLLLIGPKRGGEFFTAEDERILATVAVQAGIAVHNVRLMDEVRAAREELVRAHRQLLVGREQEQRRLAHALHDGTVQELLGISYQLADIRRRVDDGQAPVLETTRQAVLGVVRQLRGLVGELRPAGLEELGLAIALESYVLRLQREGGAEMPEIEWDLDPDQAALPEPVAICLFRAAQEALRNALKHARARHIRLSLRLLPGEVVLRVEDDGCGFRVPARLSQFSQADHFGLVSLAERVAWAGGELEIRSQPGAGTMVTVWMPTERGSRGAGVQG